MTMTRIVPLLCILLATTHAAGPSLWGDMWLDTIAELSEEGVFDSEEALNFQPEARSPFQLSAVPTVARLDNYLSTDTTCSGTLISNSYAAVDECTSTGVPAPTNNKTLSANATISGGNFVQCSDKATTTCGQGGSCTSFPVACGQAASGKPYSVVNANVIPAGGYIRILFYSDNLCAGQAQGPAYFPVSTCRKNADSPPSSSMASIVTGKAQNCNY